jgi:glycosyltransferase involved in cell wall biosynthesis
MRVAIVAEVFLPKIDGVVHRTLNLIRQLQRFGDEVIVLCPQANGSKDSPVPLVEFPSFSFPLYPEYRVGLPGRRLVSAVEDFAPDVLHFINPFAFGFRCYDVLLRGGVRRPCVFSFHTLYGEFVKGYRMLRPLSSLLWWMTRHYHNRADVNLTVSSIMQQELRQRGFERVELWPPAVDVDLFHPGSGSPEMRARLLRGQNDKKLLLTVSRLAPEKNVGFLASVLDQVPDACLAIVGDGPQRAELERLFASRNAHFVGYLKGKELAAAYASADAFVYASETETMGNVVLEAMACGCAVVAPRAGGIPSLVEHGKTGLLFTPGQLDEAVQFTRQALTPAFRSQVGQAARSGLADWSWGHAIARVREYYQQAIDRYQPTPARWSRGQRMAQLVLGGLVHTFRRLAPADKPSATAKKALHPST